MKMSDLILAVGDDNVKFQNLDRDVVAVDMTKKGTKISFYTDAVQAEDFIHVTKRHAVGLVLWLPRDKVEAAIAAEKAAKSA